MNELLAQKVKELDSSQDYECWYLVKQETSFVSVCYQVAYLQQFQQNERGMNLEEFIKKSVEKLKYEKPSIEVSTTHRALRVAVYFGLITMKSKSYNNAEITATFNQITERCNGEYENTNLYMDIIQRQIEKMFISSSIDEGSNGVRQEFRLYPVILLYKVLLELGRATGKYSITMNEYRYLVATTRRFENFLETLLLITLLRKDSSVDSALEKYRKKFDNRLIQALKQLPTLFVSENEISLIDNKIDEVAEKVYIFEQNPSVFTTDNYIRFLASTYSLFQLDQFNENSHLFKNDNQEDISTSRDFDSVDRLAVGRNTLLYGVPGCGKSYTIEREYIKEGARKARIVFHPDYTYADFVGQILPVVSIDSDGNKSVSYEFTPGPFTTILKDAYYHPEIEYFLIIEEINRGNAPAIFGEVFQLLDRKTEIDLGNDDGFPLQTSKYEINNADIATYVYGDKEHKIRIPSNLSFIGTMNTSDQNVFTLDTAFQRRWEMRLIENVFREDDTRLANTKILDTTVTWKKFCTSINEIILDSSGQLTSSEDKRLGTHFVQISDLQSKGNDEQYTRAFPEKVIKYLWDDAFKFSREEIFDVTNYNSLEKIICKFSKSKGNERFDVFLDSVKDILVESQPIIGIEE